MSESDLVQAVYKRITCSLLNKSAKGSLRHIRNFRDFCQGHRLAEVGVHILKYLFYPAAVVVIFIIRKSSIRKHLIVLRYGQVM